MFLTLRSLPLSLSLSLASCPFLCQAGKGHAGARGVPGDGYDSYEPAACLGRKQLEPHNMELYICVCVYIYRCHVFLFFKDMYIYIYTDIGTNWKN